MIEFVSGDPLQIPCDALLWPDDVMQIMGPGGVLDLGAELPEQDLQNAVDSALAQQPLPMNHVIVEPHPGYDGAWLIRLIVHNFEDYPSTSPEVVEKALAAAYELLKQQQIKTLAVKPIGMDFGGLSPWEWGVFLGALYRRTESGVLSFLRRIIIVADSPTHLRQIELGFEQSSAIMNLHIGGDAPAPGDE